MDMTMIVACVMWVVALALGVNFYMQKQAAPSVDLREKLKNLSRDPEGTAREITLGMEDRNKVPKVDYRKIFSQFTGQAYMEKLEKALTQSDIPMKGGEFLMLRICVTVAGFFGTLVYTGVIAYALLAGAVLAVIHVPILKIKRSMRVEKFVVQLAEFLILITNSLRAGQTFLQGVDVASKESPHPIGTEFRQLLKETNLGLPVEEAFNNMLVRVPSEDLKIVMSAFSIQRNVGGNLADIMDQVAAMIRQRIQIQGQIKVLTTQGKLSGAIVGLLPVGLGTIISMVNYDYMSKLWTVIDGNWTGPILLGMGIFMQMLGCLVIYKICDIEV
jgi:tight adherence protein B